MGFPAYSPEWAAAYRDEINRSSVYRQAAATWEGTVGLIILAEPDKSFPEDRGVFMDLWHGEARDIRMVSREEAGEADFSITASYSRWKQVAKRELDPTKGLMLGKLKLRGNLAKLLRYTKASQVLTECTARLAVEWPDEAARGGR